MAGRPRGGVGGRAHRSLRDAHGGLRQVKVRSRAGLTAAGALVFLSACSSSERGPTDRPPVAANAAELRSVSLPDLTGMAPVVQQQLRAQADEVARLEADKAPPSDRAAGYGEL